MLRDKPPWRIFCPSTMVSNCMRFVHPNILRHHLGKSCCYCRPSFSEALGMLLRLSAHLPHSCFFGLYGSKTASIANHASTLPGLERRRIIPVFHHGTWLPCAIILSDRTTRRTKDIRALNASSLRPLNSTNPHHSWGYLAFRSNLDAERDREDLRLLGAKQPQSATEHSKTEV
ncbi:hypothetical protein BDV11DRAFT_120827 [Aspergillus similis]